MLNVQMIYQESRHDETMWVMANDPCACRLLLGRNHDSILVSPAAAPSFLIQLPTLQASAVFQGVHSTSGVLVYIPSCVALVPVPIIMSLESSHTSPATAPSETKIG
jgi:hypothetical protein